MSITTSSKSLPYDQISLKSEQIQKKLTQYINEMKNFEKCGNFEKADKCKKMITSLKKELHQKELQQMISRHKKEKRTTQKQNQEQLKLFNSRWNKEIEQYRAYCQRSKIDLQTKHQNEMATAKIDLANQISQKVKQSSQCLNLRKIQEQLIKQKKYTQAQQTQTLICQLQIKQKEIHNKQRLTKIQTFISILKSKQQNQKQIFLKKQQTNQYQLNKQKSSQENKINLKFINLKKQNKSKHQKEIIQFKGGFKSKGGKSSLSSEKNIGRNNSINKNK